MKTINVNEYDKLVKAVSPASSVVANSFKAFLFGGSICAIGQMLNNFFTARGSSQDDAGLLTAAVLITAAIVLTGFGLYDRLAKHAGAGTVVPITGFANSIAAPAIEHKNEGLVMGVGARMFLIAGPVLVYGLLASTIVGIAYYVFR